ncbi:hypothetical protein AKJ16_DCAP03556 [Drosera capensis]
MSNKLTCATCTFSVNPINPDHCRGKAVSSVKFYPPRADKTVVFSFLSKATDRQGNNLYPYVHLPLDGNLFVFANNQAVISPSQSTVAGHSAAASPPLHNHVSVSPPPHSSLIRGDHVRVIHAVTRRITSKKDIDFLVRVLALIASGSMDCHS